MEFGFCQLFFHFFGLIFLFSQISAYCRCSFILIQYHKDRPAVGRTVFVCIYRFICFRIVVICASEYPFLSSSVRIALSLRP